MAINRNNPNNRPVVRWDLPSYSPSALGEYETCPEMYLLGRVLKTPPAQQEGSIALAKGSVAHRLISRYTVLDVASRQQLLADLAGEAMRELAADKIAPDHLEYAAALAEVTDYAKKGFAVVDERFANARILVVEQFLDMPWDKPPVPFRLLARLDLIAVYPDGTVETLDWKTGADRGLDQTQNVICRLVTQANLQRLLGQQLEGLLATDIVTSVCHLATGVVTEQRFTNEDLQAHFRDIRSRILRIENAKSSLAPGSRDWMPQPGWMCRFCKFSHACSYQLAASNEDAMAWLVPDTGL